MGGEPEDEIHDRHAPCAECSEEHPAGALEGGCCPSCCDGGDDA